MLNRLPQSMVLRNILEAVNQDDSKMKLQVGRGLCDPWNCLQLLLAHLLQAHAFSIKCYCWEKTNDKLLYFVHKSTHRRKIIQIKFRCDFYFNDDIVIKYAELTRISNSPGHCFTEQLKKLTYVHLKVDSITKQALLLPKKNLLSDVQKPSLEEF